MRYSDIKVGHIYFVDLTPVQKYEFGGNHLGLVLSKGYDKRTVTIVSLTSKSSGEGENKLNAGIIPSLPKRLIQDKNGNPVNSYIVLDQVRTVVSNRLQYVKDGQKPDGTDNFIECPIGSIFFSEIIHLLADLRISNLNDEDKIGEYHKNAFFKHCVNKMVNLTYDVIKGKGNVSAKKDEIIYFYNNALAMKKDFLIDAYLTSNDIENKIHEKINDIVLIPVK